MSGIRSVRALMEFEDAEADLLLEPVPGSESLLWPLGRWPVLSALTSGEVGTTAAVRERQPLRNRVLKAVRRALPNPRLARRAPRADHLFLVSGWTRTPVADGYENWLVDDFARALGEDAVVVQDAYVDLLSRGHERPTLPRTYTYAREGERVVRATKPLREHERARVEEVVREWFARIDVETTTAARDRAVTDIVGRAAAVPAAELSFARLLDRVRPHRLYVQTAAYGERSPLVRMAHASGIEVWEPQHGFLGPDHGAYNMGRAMSSPALRDHVPDTLLTFGEFWQEGLSFPGRVIPVGKPSLDRLSRTAPGYEDRPKRVLFVSNRYRHDRLEDVVLALRAALPDWTIAIRPHPTERSTIRANVPRIADLPCVEFDDTADASAALSRARLVVGFFSTMLYEALAYGCHVAVVETHASKAYASERVFPLRISDETDVSAVVAATAGPPAAAEREATSRVWRRDPVRAFLDAARL